MTISYYDFKDLPRQSQYEIVLTEGQLISETLKDELKFIFYEVSSFSVEIVYSTINKKMAGLNVFQNKATYGK